jgi:hypothetical protein
MHWLRSLPAATARQQQLLQLDKQHVNQQTCQHPITLALRAMHQQLSKTAASPTAAAAASRFAPASSPAAAAAALTCRLSTAILGLLARLLFSPAAMPRTSSASFLRSPSL